MLSFHFCLDAMYVRLMISPHLFSHHVVAAEDFSVGGCVSEPNSR